MARLLGTINRARPLCAALALALLIAAPFARAEEPAKPDAEAPAQAQTGNYETVALRGKVVWLAEALQRRFGIETDADAAEATCALEADDGQIYPLVKDSRGRGFWLDERLRDTDVELLARRYGGAPAVQVITVYTLKDDGKYEFDYWCDVCSIPMYELKVCECCQGPIRIRERRVGPRSQRASADDANKDAAKNDAAQDTNTAGAGEE